MNRISQRELLPTAVKNRSLGNIIKITDVVEGSSTISNNEDLMFTTILTNNMSANIIGEPEWSLWQDSISAANLIPNGSGVDMSQYQIMGPWNEWTEAIIVAGAIDIAVPKFVLTSRIYIRNISSGAATPIIARARLRYITNLLDVT